MLKKYLGLAILFIFIDLSLVFLNWYKILPFSNIAFFLLFLIGLIFLAYFYFQEFFWFFLASFSLENVFLTPENFPISLRLFQICGVVLFLGLVLRKILKKKQTNQIIEEDEINSKNKDWIEKGVFLWIVTFSLGGWKIFSFSEDLKWFLIVTSFVFIFWITRKFLFSWKEKAEGLFFFLIGSYVVWISGFYQTIARILDWENFTIMDGRINATFLEPDWLGIYSAFILALFLGLKFFFSSWENGQKIFFASIPMPIFLNYLLNIKIFFWGILLVLTVSRSAWLATLIVIFCYAGFLFLKNLKNKINFTSNLFKIFKEISSISLILTLSFLVVKIFDLSDFNLLNRMTSTISGQQKITISCKKDESLPEKIENLEELEILGCRHINLEEIEKEISLGFFVKEINRPDPNIDLRKKIYITIWSEIKKHPWLGQGWGTSARILGQDNQGNGLNTSNIFLEIWLSAGLIGLISFLVVLFLAIGQVLKMPLKIRGFFLFSGVAFFVANFFNAGIFSGFFWVWLASISQLFNFNKK